jgi:hypothetical protein
MKVCHQHETDCEPQIVAPKEDRPPSSDPDLAVLQPHPPGNPPAAGHGTSGTERLISLEELRERASYHQHPYGQVWQQFDPATFAELAADIGRRGLDHRITLYHDLVLDGYYRYLACLAKNVTPTFSQFRGTDLQAAEFVQASGLRRPSTAEQRYAAFLLLCEACPDFKQKYENLAQLADKLMKDGKPLATGDQRLDVVLHKARAAGVSKSTAKKFERVKRQNPQALAQIASGRTSANKELKAHAPQNKNPLNGPKANADAVAPHLFDAGDTICRVSALTLDRTVPVLQRYTVRSVRPAHYVSAGGEKILKTAALTEEAARAHWLDLTHAQLAAAEQEVTSLQVALLKSSGQDDHDVRP